MIVQPYVSDYQRQQLNISPDIIIVIDDENYRIKKTIEHLQEFRSPDVRLAEGLDDFVFVYLKREEICINRSSFDEQFYNSLTRSNLIARLYPCQGAYNSFLTEELPDWLNGMLMERYIRKFLIELKKRNNFNILTQLVWIECTDDFEGFINERPKLKKRYYTFRNEHCHYDTGFTASWNPDVFRSFPNDETIAIKNYVCNLIEIPDAKDSIEQIYDIFGVKEKDTSYVFPDIHICISKYLIPFDRLSTNWFEPIYFWVGDIPGKCLEWQNNRRTLAATLYFLFMTKMGKSISSLCNFDNDRNFHRMTGLLMNAYFGNEADGDTTLLSDFSRAKSDFKRNMVKEANKYEVRWNVFRKDGRETYLNISPENIHLPESILQLTNTYMELND